MSLRRLRQSTRLTILCADGPKTTANLINNFTQVDACLQLEQFEQLHLLVMVTPARLTAIPVSYTHYTKTIPSIANGHLAVVPSRLHDVEETA
jgi:hypothetical protein